MNERRLRSPKSLTESLTGKLSGHFLKGSSSWFSLALLLWGWTPSHSQAEPVQPRVGQIVEVRLVDTISGQDIEISTDLAPSHFRPVREENCTAALVVPGLLPGPDVAGRFFSSDLVENLTVSVVPGQDPATRICVRASVPVRSRVALRPSGLTVRLERTRPERTGSQEGTESPGEDEANGSALGEGESFRPVEETRVALSGAGSRTESSGSSKSGRRRTGGDESSRSRERRELELSAREAQVQVRELKLEIGQLQRQLTEQVSASAALDQKLARRQGASDQLTPRIDRLLRAVGVNGNAMERPIELFDEALAVLQGRLLDLSTSNADYGALRVASNELVATVLNDVDDPVSGNRLVVTNEDVNVRLGPNTEAARIAFFPKGILLLIKETRGAWSLVSSGGFEGWIFDELLSREQVSKVVLGQEAAAGSAVEGLRLAADQVGKLQMELALTRRLTEELAENLEGEEARNTQTLDARNASLEVATLDARDSAQANAALRGEINTLTLRIEETGPEIQGLRELVQDTESRYQAALNDLERLEGLDSSSQETAGPRHSSVAEEFLVRLQALASLTNGDQASVVTTDLTNLRGGPGVDNERLALLPRGFELTLLGQDGTWYQVVYGSLRGWVSMDFSRLLDGGSEVPDLESIDGLLQRVERGLARITIETQAVPSTLALQPSSVDDVQDSRQHDPVLLDAGLPDVRLADDVLSNDGPPDSGVLQSAANAIYAHAADARKGNIEAYLAFYSQRFTPQEGGREAWEEKIRERFALGEFAQEQVHRLALRSISETQVEARFYGAKENAIGKRLDLMRDQEGWKVLLETADIQGGDQE